MIELITGAIYEALFEVPGALVRWIFTKNKSFYKLLKEDSRWNVILSLLVIFILGIFIYNT